MLPSFTKLHMFLFHKENLGLRKEFREAIQKFTNNLIVKAGHKLLCDDSIICGLIFPCNRFRNFVQNIFLKSLLFYGISEVWLRNDSLLLY